MVEFIKKRPFILFLIPGTIFYTILIIYPIFSAMQLSLYKWNGIGPKVFVGLGNYVELFTDSFLMGQFVNALANSLKLFCMTILIQMPIQIVLSYMIYSKMKGHRFVQTMIFAPQLITTPVIVIIFNLILDSNIGAFNGFLEAVGLGAFAKPWLGIPELGILFLFLMITWCGIGVGMTFLLGAMNMIGRDGLEAAYMEGAGFWKRLFLIIVPQIKITIVNLSLVGYIFCMTVFDFSYLLGNGVSGGIDGSIDVMALFFYRIAFGDVNPVGGKIAENSMGMGTAVACVLFLLIFVIALLQIVFLNKEEK